MKDSLFHSLQTSLCKDASRRDDEIREAAERSLGAKFATFVRVAAGNSSVNFKACESDGKNHLVRFFREKARPPLEILHLVAGRLVPGASFGGGSFPVGNGWHVCAFEWREGENVDPALLTDAQIASLAKAYREFSDTLGKAAGLPADRDLSCLCAGIAPRPIHGDMHFKNVFFEGDEATSFFDLEKIRLGFPTEDLLRYFIHAAERTRFWRFARMAAIKRNFAKLVRVSGCPASAWLAAIDLYVERKREHRAAKSRSRILLAMEDFFRGGLYRSFRRIAVSAPQRSSRAPSRFRGR